MKMIKLALGFALASAVLSIEVNINRAAPNQQQFAPSQPGVPQQNFAQQAAPQQAKPVKQAAPQQTSPQKPAGLQGGMGGFGGFPGLGVPGLANGVNNFLPSFPSSFDDVLTQASAPAFPAGFSPNQGSQAPAQTATPQLAAAQAQMATVQQQQAAQQAAQQQAAAPQAQPSFVLPERPLAGGWTIQTSAADVAGVSPFLALPLVSDMIQQFLGGQANGSTVLVYLASQVVAGTNFRVIFRLNGAFLGAVVFVPLPNQGAAKVIQFHYSQNVQDVLQGLGLAADTRFTLEVKLQDNIAAQSSGRPRPAQAAPNANANRGPAQAQAPAQGQLNILGPQQDLNQAAFAGLGVAPQRVQAAPARPAQQGQNTQNFGFPAQKPVVLNIGSKKDEK